MSEEYTPLHLAARYIRYEYNIYHDSKDGKRGELQRLSSAPNLGRNLSCREIFQFLIKHCDVCIARYSYL